MIIKYLDTSAFWLQSGQHRLLIDPGSKKHGDIQGQYVYVTHRHFDHSKGAESFLEKNPDARLICNAQVAEKFSKYQDRIITAEKGGKITAGPWSLRFVEAEHGLLRGEMNYGILVQLDNLRFGHAGDAREFSGFADERMDYFALPIGSVFTASPKQAVSELKKFRSPLPTIIPIHNLLRSLSRFKKRVESAIPDTRCKIMAKGEELEV